MAKVLFTSTEERFDDWFLEEKTLFILFWLICKNYPKLAANFLVKMPVSQSECPREQFKGSYFLEKNEIFQQFRNVSKKIQEFWKKNSCKIVKIALNVSRLTFWGICFKKFHFFSTFSENEQKAIQLLAEFFRHVFQKCIWRLQKNILRLFLKKLHFFHHFWTLSSEIHSKLAENLQQACQKCIIVVKGNILRKNNSFGQEVHVFSDCYWTSSQFCFKMSTKIFQHRCPNFILLIRGKSLSRNFFWKN